LPVVDREKWNARWSERAGEPPAQPSTVLVALADLLPSRGRALDVAGGAGRHARWLARRGLDVTLVDVSDVAVELARRDGIVARLHDLEELGLPAGPWDLILDYHYLHRPLFEQFGRELARGGCLVMVHPTRRNLERHARPPLELLLDEGELGRLVAVAGLEIVRYEEGWLEEGRHEGRAVAIKKG
jgi:SAM-dependent methyltransferase